jgi:hypothetical protein
MLCGRLCHGLDGCLNYFRLQGEGLMGCYSYVYAVNPTYKDPRDSRVYAANGYGLPVAVPLAPNVRHTYNYGWGVPSSRVTPISRFMPSAYASPPIYASPAN